MSHFCGLVILTPEYQKANSFEDSLAKYDENLEMPEYRKEDLSDGSKVDFLEFYSKEQVGNHENLARQFWENTKQSLRDQIIREYSKVTGDDKLSMYDPEEKWLRIYGWASYHFKDDYTKWFKRKFRKVWDGFEALYAEKGDEWNGNNWRKDENGVWAEYSKYNPDSKWDWYSVGGRWMNSIKTKENQFVNQCKLSEIDFTPYPEDCYVDGKDWLGKPCKELKEGLEWHYSTEDCPFCLILDGVWYERGEMGWWACVSNEKDKDVWNEEVGKLLAELPEDSVVYNVDFHI